jgi:hypothetical protein
LGPAGAGSTESDGSVGNICAPEDRFTLFRIEP